MGDSVYWVNRLVGLGVLGLMAAGIVHLMEWWARRGEPRPKLMVQMALDTDMVSIDEEWVDSPSDVELVRAFKDSHMWVDCPSWQGDIARARLAFPHEKFRIITL